MGSVPLRSGYTGSATSIVDPGAGQFLNPHYGTPAGREIMVQEIIAWAGMMNVARPGIPAACIYREFYIPYLPARVTVFCRLQQ